jgi:hypothetical protein
MSQKENKIITLESTLQSTPKQEPDSKPEFQSAMDQKFGESMFIEIGNADEPEAV